MSVFIANRSFFKNSENEKQNFWSKFYSEVAHNTLVP